MAIQFYDVKNRKKVDVSEKEVKKVKYVRETSKGSQTRYALSANVGGVNLTKFVSEADWKKLDAPEA
mgnify:CR=1 FL=1